MAFSNSILILVALILLIQLPASYSITREFDIAITYAPLKDDPKRMAIHGNGVYPLPTIICDPGDLMRIRIRNNIVTTTKRSNKRKRVYGSINNFTDINIISKDNIDAFSIHFHGILQHNYNFALNESGNTIINGLADGVPFITQLPTLPGQTYLYEFSIDAKQAGTFFIIHIGPCQQ